MNRRSPMKLTVATDGRLPTPAVEWPITPEGLARLSGLWRKGHVWLSLWNQKGQLVEFDRQGGRFWTTLAARPEPFVRQLGEFARKAVEADAGGGGGELADHRRDALDPPRADGQGSAGATGDLGPWEPDLGLLAAPVRWRHRTVGVVLGAVVLTEQPGEAFSRLCSQCGVDARAMAGFAAEVGAVQPGQAKEMERLLRNA